MLGVDARIHGGAIRTVIEARPGGICLHRGGPLAEGRLDQCVVTCPWHGWQFDVTTGALVQDSRVGVSRHDTRIVGDDVQVRLRD